MDHVHKQEYCIRDLPTRSVTLFPARAQVLRDIKDVPLKPGTNEITILGLSPSVDEDSIKVDGTGSATISDIAVELLPNRDIFQEVYPDDESDGFESEPEEEDDEDGRHKDSDALKSVRAKLVALRDSQKHAQELSASAESRLKILDAYGNMLGTKKAVDIESGLETYRRSRETVFQDHMAAKVRHRELANKIAESTEEETRLVNLQLKERNKAMKAKTKLNKNKDKVKEKERLREAEKRKESSRVDRERRSFWPRYCWSVRIILDVVAFTPSPSRRSSMTGVSDIVKAVPDKESAEDPDATTSTTCDLSLSYVTSSAWWSPSYDLALTTTSNTAQLCFDAQLTNRTSENWTGCKIVLSTSQTTFSGIQDAIPTLVPWRIRLGAKGFGAKASDVLDSREERAEKGGWVARQNAWGAEKPRNHLYGLPNAAAGFHPTPQPSTFGMSAQPVPESFGSAAPQSQFASTFGQSARGEPLFGASNYAPLRTSTRKSPDAPSRGFGRTATFDTPGDVPDVEACEEVVGEENDAETVFGLNPDLTFQESAFEETGMTTTYDLPGLKTLNTSSTASKQRVARVSFGNVVFSHTVVAKYRPVAYLKAKLRNTSKFTLLKGPMGLSLDGSFIGRSTVPRCSAGDSLTISLGIDPTIRVAYPKPDVKRSRSGLFAKEDSHVYTRTVIIHNTKLSSGRPVNIVVLDQVPVSEDDKLRIEIMNPRGLAVGSGGVRTGLPAKDGGDDRDWGRATATLKKAGEVSWDVVLNPGRGVKVALEYEVVLPAGDHVIQC